MNRMGPLVLVLATANAVLAASMAGALAAVAVFLVLVAAGFLFFRLRRPEAAPAPAPRPDVARQAGPVGAEAITIGRQGAYLLVRVGTRDWPARPADGAALPRYGDPVRVVGADGAVLVVRPLG
jgi:membrane protein implicated in regulation of membrane protease activity